MTVQKGSRPSFEGQKGQDELCKLQDMAEEGLMTEAELAQLLHVSLSTVKRLRVSGEGPPYVKIGRRAIRYDREAVREWLRRRAQE